jgi:hypothetical protein
MKQPVSENIGKKCATEKAILVKTINDFIIFLNFYLWDEEDILVERRY